MVVILAVLAFLIVICLLSTGKFFEEKKDRFCIHFVVWLVLICCCCRAAFNAIIRRLCPTKTKSLESTFDSVFFFFFDRLIFISEGEIVVATGEDAGLMKSLTTPNVLTALPQQQTEPATLIIDSTKPIYPRLQ